MHHVKSVVKNGSPEDCHVVYNDSKAPNKLELHSKSKYSVIFRFNSFNVKVFLIMTEKQWNKINEPPTTMIATSNSLAYRNISNLIWL